MRKQKAYYPFGKVRETIGEQCFTAGGAAVNFTISTGVTTKVADTLQAAINRADELLYQAKEDGCNRVVLD